MKTETLFRQTKLKGSKAEIWDYFSKPHNLANITPPDMGFKVLTKDLPEGIHEGLLIDYTVRPAFNIPTKWTTEIGAVEEGEYFIDTQLKGPYKRWEHTHVFEECEDGVLMTDHVVYELPGGNLGKLLSHWIERRLSHIFDYREKVINEQFN